VNRLDGEGVTPDSLVENLGQNVETNAN